jgi:hypothetical protein
VNREAIKSFVQSTLGCGCPEEVFQHIACESGINQNGFRIRYKQNIGNRLLIYIFPVVSADSLQETLQRLVDVGKGERDRSGFNRFRLVLTADDEVRIRERAEDLFQKIRKDERVHLHIFPETSIPQF